MLWNNMKRDRKCTLLFNTRNGIKRSKPNNSSDEQVNPEHIEEQSIGHFEGERDIAGEDNING